MKRVTPKFYLLLLSTAVLLTLFSQTVYGEVIDRAEMDLDSGRVTITGTIPNVQAGRTVTVQMLTAGTESEALLTAQPETVMDILAYAGETTVGADGKYSIVAAGRSESGECVIRVSSHGMEPVETTCYYFSQTDRNAMLSALNTGDVNAVAALLEENGAALGVEEMILSGVGAQALAQSLVDQRQTPFAKLSEAVETVRSLGVVELVKHAGQPEDFVEIIEENQVFFEDCGAYETYLAMTQEQKKYALDKILDANFANGAELKTVFDQKVMLSTLAGAGHYTEVKDLLEKIGRVLNLNLSYYHSLSSTTAVDKAICKKWYDTPEQLLQAIRNVEANPANPQPSYNGSGGSRGGSTGRTQTVVNGGDDQNNPDSQPAAPERFSDLDQAAWAETEVLALCQRGIVSGYEDGSFRPNANISREEFAKIIVMAYGLYQEGQECDFEDVDKSMWYYPYIASAKAADVIQGRDARHFGTGEPVTRQEMATMAYRAAVQASPALFAEAGAETPPFTDLDQIDEYAREAASALYNRQIIQGMEDGRFAPKDYATRAESCKILWNLISYAK